MEALSHPVHFAVVPSTTRRRLHLLARLVILVALGAIGWSSVYWAAYLALPAVAAILVATKGGARYLEEDGPAAERVLRWIAAAYAYLSLLTDLPPSETVREDGAVELRVQPCGAPTGGSALARLLYTLPALLLACVLSMVATVAWVIGALGILFVERAPSFIVGFLELTLRYELRLVAYHLSLVDRYPSFAEDVAAPIATSSAA